MANTQRTSTTRVVVQPHKGSLYICWSADDATLPSAASRRTRSPLHTAAPPHRGCTAPQELRREQCETVQGVSLYRAVQGPTGSAVLKHSIRECLVSPSVAPLTALWYLPSCPCSCHIVTACHTISAKTRSSGNLEIKRPCRAGLPQF